MKDAIDMYTQAGTLEQPTKVGNGCVFHEGECHLHGGIIHLLIANPTSLELPP